MKKITLKKKDAYDLCMVMGTVVREQSEKLDFKEVLYIQKTINSMMDGMKDFSDELEKLNKERNGYIETANKKIVEFRAKVNSTSEKEGKIDEVGQKRIDAFVQTMLQDAQTEIEAEITPKNKVLNEVKGIEVVVFELEDEKHKLFISNFEKYAKEKYNDKKVMVETYEALTV